MSVIAELQVSIGADIKRLERGLSKAQRRIQDAGRSMQRVGRSLTMAVTAPLAGVGGMALKTAADFESLQQSMNILNGSVEEGTRNFERLQEFSATTPFQLNELAQAQNMLQGFGQSADDAFESMQMIGDIAAVASGDIQGIGIAFGQAAAEGRLMTRDIRQLINQGVPAIKLLADTMGVAQSEVLDLASEGEISFEILQESFRDATSEGGMFANGMAKQAQTLAGRFSTMKDNINLALGAVGDTMGGLAKNVMGSVIDMTKAFRDMDEQTRQLIATAGILAAAIPPLIFLGGKLLTVFSALISPIGLAVAAIGGLVVISKNLYDNWEVIEAELINLWDGIELAAWKIVEGIFDAFKWMGNNTLSILSNMAAAVSPSLVAPIELARTKIDAAGDSIQQSVEDSKKEFEESGKVAVEARKDMVSLSDSFWSIGEAIEEGVMWGLRSLSDQLFETGEDVEEFAQMDFTLNLDTEGGIGDVSDKIRADLTGLEEATEQYRNKSITEIALVDSAWKRFSEAFRGAGEQMSMTADAVNTAFQSMSDKTIKSLGDLVTVVYSTARKIIAAQLAQGIAAAVKSALTNVPFPLNIAAAASAGAAASGVFNAVVPKLAQGGLAFGPTMAVVGDNANARSNPEVIAPLDKLQGMISQGGGTERLEAVIRGSDIHLANERGKNKFR